MSQTTDIPTAGAFDKPIATTALERAFGGDMEKLLPRWDTIPEDFRRSRTPWNKLFSTWFYEGLPKDMQFFPKEGITASDARAHLRAVMVSFAPKHEHKEAGCAYLMSLWFDKIEQPA